MKPKKKKTPDVTLYCIHSFTRVISDAHGVPKWYDDEQFSEPFKAKEEAVALMNYLKLKQQWKAFEVVALHLWKER